MKIYFFLLFVFHSCLLWAQLPVSNLYLFDLQVYQNQISLSNPRFLSNKNVGGYNNQPSFFDDNRFFFVSDMNSKGKTDIYLAEVPGKILKRFTSTLSDEYSPKLHTDKRTVNCIRVNPENPLIQEIWQYPYDRSVEGIGLYKEIQNAGYFLRKSDDTIAIFLVEDRSKLITITGKNQRKYEVSRDVGRCLGLLPDGNLLFVHKLNDEYWYLKNFNWETKTQIIAQMPLGVEDFAVLSDGTIICGKESTIMILPPNTSVWISVFSLKNYDLTRITRIAVNNANNKLLIVNQKD
jgi:hypothetical protein